MSRAHTLLPLAGLLAALLPATARADHAFILPSTTMVSGEGNTVTFDAAGSDHVFFFDHRPLQLASIVVTRPDGTPGTAINMAQGRFRSVLDLRLDQQGTWKVASSQTMIGGSFKLDGEERRVGRRPGPPPGAAGGERHEAEARGPDRERGGPLPGAAPDGPRRQPPVAFEDIPANATDVHLTEIVNRTETFVTAGAPTTPALRLSGHGLELDPVTHPNALAQGETASFRFLVDGQPAAGLKVTVVPGGDRYRDNEGAMSLTTGADGKVAIRWPAAGMYWIGTEAEDAHPAEKRAERRHMSYAATLEVMTP